MDNASGAYQRIVEKVKAKFAKLDRPYAGDETSAAIATAWAKHCKRPHDNEKPATPADVPATPFAPSPGDFDETSAVEERTPGSPGRVTLPGMDDTEDEE